MTYEQMGQRSSKDADQIMWGQVASADGFRIMAFDVLEPRPYDLGENAFFVSVRGDAASEVNARWTSLSEGATILYPIGEAP